jgi:hypothetical protein
MISCVLEEQRRQIVGSARLSVPHSHRTDLRLAQASLLRKTERFIDDSRGNTSVALMMCSNTVQDHQIAASDDIVAHLVKQRTPVAGSIHDGLQSELFATKWEDDTPAYLKFARNCKCEEICPACCRTDQRLRLFGDQQVT